MKEHDFDSLVESVRHAGRIRRREAKPGRMVEFPLRARLPGHDAVRGLALTGSCQNPGLRA
jgi:hypothetical protein